uniref:C2H2-type domain-containing protein n=1 Tax=Eptatretus burgeri TaxID=7764 RepID=A0A8C4QPN8_EPTBU
MIEKETQLSIEGPTIDSACQSRNSTLKSKELSIERRDRIVRRHRSGEGYKTIYRVLEVPKNTLSPIIRKWIEYGTPQTLPRAVRLTKLSNLARRTHAEQQMAVAWSGEGATTDAGTDVVVSTETEMAMAAENRTLEAVTTLSAPTVTDSHVYCSDCGVGFAYRSLLLAHRRRHTGEKPFACELCGRRFSLSHNLARHRRIHTGETYACTECGKRFSRAYLLSHHKRTHLHFFCWRGWGVGGREI